MVPIPNELLQMVKTNINILLEAIEKDENPEQQIAYRKMVAQGSYDSTPEGSFQIVTELIVDQRYFLKDGDIEIITDPVHKPEPYKVMPAEDMQPKEDSLIKTPQERDNLDLLELVCQLHSRALMYPSKHMHDAYMEARTELEKRLSPPI